MIGIGIGIETEIGIENETETDTEMVIETRTENGIGTEGGTTALGLVLGLAPGRGIGSAVMTDPEGGRAAGAPGAAPPAHRRTLTAGGTNTWTDPLQRSPPLGTFTAAKSLASCSLVASCSSKGSG